MDGLIYLLDKHFYIWREMEFKNPIEFNNLIWRGDDDSLRLLQLRLELYGNLKTYPFPIILCNGNIVSNVNIDDMKYLLLKINNVRDAIEEESKVVYSKIKSLIEANVIKTEKSILNMLIDNSSNMEFIDKVIGKGNKDFTSKMNDINIRKTMKHFSKYNLQPPKKPKGPEPRYIKY